LYSEHREIASGKPTGAHSAAFQPPSDETAVDAFVSYIEIVLRELAMPRLPEIWKTFLRAIDSFLEDDCITFAAALAYYAVFSLPPLLFLIATLAGSTIGWTAIEHQLVNTIQSLAGQAVADQLRSGLESFAPRLKPDSLMIIGSFAFLLFAATGVLVQLQSALNRAWAVRPDPRRGYWRNLLMKRLISLLMIVALTAIMLVSVLVSTGVAIAGERISHYIPTPFSDPLLRIFDLVSGFGIFFVAFAAVYQIMPDADVEWKDVWIGSGVTAALLTFGRFGVSLYLGSRDIGGTFGPAAALAVLLLWIYYASIIVLFGAEFTHCWASRSGRRIRPSEGAVAVIKARVDQPGATPEETGCA
jgi:membrane protein